MPRPRKKPRPPGRPRKRPEVKSYDKLPWATVRQEYETTEITLAALQERYEIKSCNTLLRRIKREGWQRDIGKITARLVTQAVAEDEAENNPNPPRIKARKRLTSKDKTQIPKEDVSSSIFTHTEDSHAAHAGPSQGAHAASPEHPEAPPPRAAAPLLALPTDDLEWAKSLADVHVKAVREQLAHANQIALAGNALLSLLLTLLTSTDSAELGEARGRLLAISADKETLAGLMKSAAHMLEASALMKRRAIGMDKATSANPATGPAAPANIQFVLQQLGPDVLMKLRQVSLDETRRSRDSRTITATPQ